MKDMIIGRGWALVCGTPLSAQMAIVREFYANARKTQNGIAFVRGKQVSYTKEAINEIFHLATLPSDESNWVEYQRYETDLDQLIQEICKLGTKWATKAGTDRKVHFPQTALSVPSRLGTVLYVQICCPPLITRMSQLTELSFSMVLSRENLLILGILSTSPCSDI